MNVLYLLNFAGHGGSENYVSVLADKLAEIGEVPSLAYNICGKLSGDFIKKGIKTKQIVMRHPFDLKAAYQLAKLCKAQKIDVVHTHFLRENYIAILSKLFNPGIRVVYTNHVMLQNNALLKVMNKVMTRFNHKIIAVCNIGKEILVDNKVSSDKIEVIYNGVDQNGWDDAAPSTIREELGIEPDTFVISCLSRFDKFKGNRFLIESISEFSKIADDRNYVFVLANEGPLWEEMKELAGELQIDDTIRFIGFRNDIKNILLGSDLYVNPSEWEALSFAMIEALSASLPIVSTDTGGTTDIINEESRCGLLVPYDQPEKMAEALKRMMTDKAAYEEMKKMAKKAAKTKFNIETMVRQTYEAYQE